MEHLTDLLLQLTGSPLVYLVILAVCAIDGFFPPVPSETSLVAVGAVAVSTGTPHLVLLGLVAAVGSIIGDNIAFLLGRRFGTSRLRRRPRVGRVLDWAGRELARRPASLVLIARYIPIGRVAVNMTAGATGMAHRTFLGLSVVAGLCWATYSLIIASVASTFAHGHPVVAAGLAVVIAVGLGLVVDRLIRSRQSRAATPTDQSSADQRQPVRAERCG